MGRGELTQWPERDWVVMIGDPSFDLIWDRPPLTSSVLWARWIGRSIGHDDHRTFTPAASWDSERQKRFDETWARLTRTLNEQPAAAPVVLRAKPEPPVERDSGDAAVRELTRVEAIRSTTGQPVELTLCAYSNKVKHRSKLWALQHRLSLAAAPDTAHPELLEVYKCKWCGAWHVGHKWVA